MLLLHSRTRQRIADNGLAIPANCKVIDPEGYLDMIMLEKHVELIVTDSGGVQKEAYFHQVPCIALRDETEWWSLSSYGGITWPRQKVMGSILQRSFSVGNMDQSPYGDGHASGRIVDTIKQFSA